MLSGKQLLIILLVLSCVGVFAIWMVELAGGAFDEGIFTYQLQGNIPIFHLIAEYGMAIVLLIGAVGWWQNRGWGRGVTLFGLGMFSYAAINSMGWALHNNVAVALPMVAVLLLAALALPLLLRGEPT
jgi:hypothetical protein